MDFYLGMSRLNIRVSCERNVSRENAKIFVSILQTFLLNFAFFAKMSSFFLNSTYVCDIFTHFPWNFRIYFAKILLSNEMRNLSRNFFLGKCEIFRETIFFFAGNPIEYAI